MYLDLALTGPVQIDARTHQPTDSKVESEVHWALMLSRDATSFSGGAIQLKIIAAQRWRRFRSILDSSRLDEDLLGASTATLIGSGPQPVVRNSQPAMSEVSSIEWRMAQAVASARHSTALIPKRRR